MVVILGVGYVDVAGDGAEGPALQFANVKLVVRPDGGVELGVRRPGWWQRRAAFEPVGEGLFGECLDHHGHWRCQRNRSPLQSLRGNTSNVEHRGAGVGVDVVATHHDAAADVGQG